MRIALRVVLVLLFLAFIVYTGSLLLNTLKILQEKKDYACRIEPKENSFFSFEGQRIEIPFLIENLGREPWSSRGKNPILLSFHLFDGEKNIIQYNNRRFPLPHEFKSGQSARVTANVISPLEKGKYILEFDLVKEGITWFKDYGSPTAKIALKVEEKKWPEDEMALSLDYGKYSKFKSSMTELNTIQKLIRLTLYENEVKFPGKTGPIRGFSAGKDYPQIWLRDAATIIPASRYFYDATYLSSWHEEHLAHQREDGALEDWIDLRGHFDKNTTETDQESSAVLAAYQIFELLGPPWLEKPIHGEKIILKLERALEFLLAHRWEKKYGLLKGAHTADWGDVDIVNSNQKAIYTNRHTHWTVDIYDQSMFYEACLKLAWMFKEIRQKDKALFWKEKAEAIRKNTDKWLWQEEKGFYRVHLHLDELRHDFDEDNIFAMGGNTQAIISGLAGEDKPPKIITEALRRQKSYGLSTISGTLLPPYPRHVFKHPMVDDPYEYQNGGQWDWYGGRLIYAMFEHGFSRTAKEKLLEIARKNLANRSFFEWDTREGIGMGNGFFCGSAGSLSRTIFEGFFGIKLGKDKLSIEPRIGEGSMKIHAYLPSNDTFVAYQYGFDEEIRKLTLEYNSNFSGKGIIKVLNPWKLQEAGEQESKRNWTVLIDGQSVDFWLERKNEDELIVIETDFKRHTLEITKTK